ncbi:hypothetical protein [Microbacterium sediminicola]|uniref:hypothetical protein n=1 Tax=Microbacterium sediminicola TaxID=415210 RepID=UPI0031DB9527
MSGIEWGVAERVIALSSWMFTQLTGAPEGTQLALILAVAVVGLFTTVFARAMASSRASTVIFRDARPTVPPESTHGYHRARRFDIPAGGRGARAPASRPTRSRLSMHL